MCREQLCSPFILNCLTCGTQEFIHLLFSLIKIQIKSGQIYERSAHKHVRCKKSIFYPVADVEGRFDRLTHAVVLEGQEQGVEHNAQRNQKVKQGIVHDVVQAVLKPKPAVVVQTALFALGAVPVFQIVCEAGAIDLLDLCFIDPASSLKSVQKGLCAGWISLFNGPLSFFAKKG